MEGHLVGAVAAGVALLTFVLIRRNRSRPVSAFRWTRAVGAGMAVFVLGLLAGLHHCDQGTPIRLTVLFGGLTFISVGFINIRRLRLVWSGALLFLAISLCYYTANLYHHDMFTGNPQFGSGRYWHSFFTGIYKRKNLLTFGVGVKSMNSNGVIFPAKEIPFGEAPFWTPTLEQVKELEGLLPEYLKSHPPMDDKPVGDVFEYGRQYFGVTNNGQKVIYLNAFCNPSRFDPQWEEEMIQVKDGGSCYFQVYFDPARKEFIHLHYNGQA